VSHQTTQTWARPTLQYMSDLDKFREVARLMTDLDARIWYGALAFKGDDPRAPKAAFLEVTRTGEFPGKREWIMKGTASMNQREADIEQIRELARLLTELDSPTWRGTLWAGWVEDPDALYLKHVRTGFLGLFGTLEWRVNLDAL
jgi:hypothetical protein